MKKILISMLVLTLALALYAPALADADKTLTVQGSATVSVMADVVTLSVGVQTQGAVVSDAQSENARIMADVIAALKAAGIAQEDIMTSDFSVYNTNTWTDTPAVPSYKVTNTLNITIYDLTRTGDIIDAATAAGANVLNGLTFDSTARNEAYQKALTRAVDDARVKAKVLTDAAGKTLGELVRIQSGEDYSYVGANGAYDLKAPEASATSIVSGNITVSASVTLVYELK